MATADKNKVAVTPEERPEHVNESIAQQKMANLYKQEELVPVSISPHYANDFGNVHPIHLNGVRIAVPCDGNTYNIPESFARELRQRIYNVDQKIKRQKRMANIALNQDPKGSPGELKLF